MKIFINYANCTGILSNSPFFVMMQFSADANCVTLAEFKEEILNCDIHCHSIEVEFDKKEDADFDGITRLLGKKLWADLNSDAGLGSGFEFITLGDSDRNEMWQEVFKHRFLLKDSDVVVKDNSVT